MSLPQYLQQIEAVFTDAGVAGTPVASRVRDKISHVEWTVLDAGQSPPKEGSILHLKEYKGRFLRHCPGTSRYRCCGYEIIHIGENCPLSCTYCILQAYFQDRILRVWANQDRLFEELGERFSANQEKRFRVGTGEFTDSLVLEPLTGYTRDLVAFLSAHSNVVLELKSKVVDLSWMEAATRTDRVLPAWSMNADRVQAEEEGGSATLEERLAGARECVRAGFRVCLHFDPIIHFPGWKQGYSRTVEMILDYLRPGEIAYLSLGSFRCMPELMRTIAANHPGSSYIYNEFIAGLDGKQRLLRPLRVEQFRHIVRLLRQGGLDRQLYLCMESDLVWKEVFGYTPRGLGGLSSHLMRQAFGEAGG